ncbi:putative Bacteriophytochrome (Light-regulated signal transduction histidine kinase) [Candidatus Terasakiella magnetica]|nr:putative Bacteriophytochrome (Light-regulated signal transduction histidine kinase) [Candidatus Terasakiella magnetica]
MDANRPHPTILIVDDTPENLHVLMELLKPSYTVRGANSAQRALAVARALPRPDLILLDIMMPEMDGYECLRRLRDTPETRDIPVIFLTALDSTEDERHGLDLGAVDYITKPIRPAIVEARIRNHLDMKFARDWLRAQNALLEAELNRFLEILAHHLQEPVRRQITFAQLLERSLPKPLNEMAEVSLSQIMEGATRLREMLHDVLLYLAVSQFPPPTETCLATAAFKAAYRQLYSKILTTGAQVTQGDLPAVWINENQLTEVFRALLDNALEYRRPSQQVRIRVKAEAKDSEIIFSVTDNSCGIPPEYREKIFWVFERLHADTSRPGTGIGLALVKKIVENAAGRVWVEDGEDGGSCIRFSLPTAAEPAPQ